MGIGYAAINQELTVSGTANVAPDLELYFSNVSDTNVSGTIGFEDDIVPTFGEGITSLTFTLVGFKNVNDTETFRVTITNPHDFDVEITQVVITDPTDGVVSHFDIDAIAGTTITAGNSASFDIKFTCTASDPDGATDDFEVKFKASAGTTTP